MNKKKSTTILHIILIYMLENELKVNIENIIMCFNVDNNRKPYIFYIRILDVYLQSYTQHRRRHKQQQLRLRLDYVNKRH